MVKYSASIMWCFSLIAYMHNVNNVNNLEGVHHFIYANFQIFGEKKGK